VGNAGSPEALATAKLISSGRVSLTVLPSHPTKPGVSGIYQMGTNKVTIYADAFPGGSLEAAAATAHETKHYLQKLTPETYHLGHEVEAYKVEGSIYPDALTNSLSDRVLYNYLRGLSGYSHVPGDPDWMRWQGTQLR
jgi:hypothetical protein